MLEDVLVAPSVLSADFARLGEDLKSIEMADYVHFDVMLVNLFEVTLFSVLCSMGMMGISSAAIAFASCISRIRSSSSTFKVLL